MDITLKAQIINNAIQLLDMLALCEDDDFVEEVVNSIYDNDVAPLWNLEDRLENN